MVVKINIFYPLRPLELGHDLEPISQWKTGHKGESIIGSVVLRLNVPVPRKSCYKLIHDVLIPIYSSVTGTVIAV